jgi:hypothetical protein
MADPAKTGADLSTAIKNRETWGHTRRELLLGKLVGPTGTGQFGGTVIVIPFLMPYRVGKGGLWQVPLERAIY